MKALGLRRRNSDGQENAQVAHVRARGAGDDGVAEVVEESVGVALVEKLSGVESSCLGARDGRLVGQGACGGAVAVDAVRPCAERERASRGEFCPRPAFGQNLLKLEGKTQRRLRVAPA